MDYIKSSNASYVVTEHFSPIYFYTNVPNIRVNNYTIIRDIIDQNYPNEKVLYYYSEGDWFNLKNEEPNLKIIYKCENHELLDISTKQTFTSEISS